MDVRLRVGGPQDEEGAGTDVLTGLADGSLKTLLATVAARHPEFQRFLEAETLDPAQLEINVNGRPLGPHRLHDFVLKDGDTVRLVADGHR